MHLLIINKKDFGCDPKLSHISTMEGLSKGNYIWSSVLNNDLVKFQKYLEEFIFPSKHHAQITEASIQDISSCFAAGISEEDYSSLVSLHTIKIAPINCDILTQVEGSKRKGNKNLTLGVSNKNQPLSCQ